MARQKGLAASGYKDNWNPEASQNKTSIRGAGLFNVLLEVLALFFFCYIFFYWAGAPTLFANYTCQHKWRNKVPFVYDLLVFQRDTRLKDEDEDEQLWVEGGNIEYI